MLNTNLVIKMFAEKGIFAEEIIIEKGGVVVKGIGIGNGENKIVCYPEDFSSEMELVNTAIEKLKTHPFVNFDVNQLFKWDFIKDKIELGIRPVIPGTDIITKKWCDLELYVYINLDQATIKVNQQILNILNITKETLFRNAAKNTSQNANIFSMDFFGPSPMPMYIVTNKDNMYGASAICNKEIANKVCDILKTNKLIIIPSSIHECITLNAHKNPYDFVISMVREINAGYVSPTEVLSNNIYIYNRVSGTYTTKDM